MKKTILFITVFSLSITTFAQSKARFALRFGANISKITNLDTKNKTDFYLGALLAIKVSDFYTLQPEFGYSQQGGTLRENNYILAPDNAKLKDINIDFLTITFINKIQANNNLNFLIGPYIDFRLEDNINNDARVLDGLFPRMDIGLTAGIGYDISKNFSIEARFKQGFFDMINEDNIYQNARDYDDNFNQVIQLGIVYRFNTITNK